MKKIDGEISVNGRIGMNSMILKTTQNPKGEIVSDLVEIG